MSCFPARGIRQKVCMYDKQYIFATKKRWVKDVLDSEVTWLSDCRSQACRILSLRGWLRR